MKNAYLISFPAHGSADNGLLTVIEHNTGLPFEVKRVYTVTDTWENNVRGEHAHHQLKQLFFALTGRIEVYCEDETGAHMTVTLDSPQVGLYCGPMVWHTLTYHDHATLMVLASEGYDEKDYIRHYDEFLERRKTE